MDEENDRIRILGIVSRRVLVGGGRGMPGVLILIVGFTLLSVVFGLVRGVSMDLRSHSTLRSSRSTLRRWDL
jgi:hypothetical protein